MGTRTCPACQTPIEFPPELAGTKFFCMKCDHDFRLPGEPAARPMTVESPHSTTPELPPYQGLSAFEPYPAAPTPSEAPPPQSARDAQRHSGYVNMMIGTCFLVGGLFVTAMTYAVASRGGGGYIIATGAIIGGAYQIIHGVMQVTKG